MVFHSFAAPTSDWALVACKHFNLVLLDHVALQVALWGHQLSTRFTLMPDTFVKNVNMFLYLASCWLGNIAAFLCLLFILTWQMLLMWSWSAPRSFGLMSFIFWGESWTVSCLWLFSLFTSISELEVVTKVQTAQMNLVEQCAMSLCICIWP